MQYTGVCILCLCTCVFHFHITIMGVSRLFLGGASTHLSFISAHPQNYQANYSVSSRGKQTSGWAVLGFVLWVAVVLCCWVF